MFANCVYLSVIALQLLVQVWYTPAIQVRAGEDIPKVQPDGNPEEYLHLPQLGWQEYHSISS
jgi:hypothetical protein